MGFDQPPPKRRLPEIDGVRGWAALMVVLYHLILETFGHVFPDFRSPLLSIINGRLAVALFFVLSGEALSSAFIARGNLRSLASLAIRRPIRLSIPVLGSVLITYTLGLLGWRWDGQAASILGGVPWHGPGADVPLTVLHAVKFAFIDMYQGPVFDYAANPMAWIMGIEFIGSFVVFAILPLIAWLRSPALVLAVAAVACLFGQNTMFIADFLFGVIFAILRHQGVFDEGRHSGRQRGATLLIASMCLLVSSYSLRQNAERPEAAIAPILAFAIFASDDLTRFFSNALSRFLGRISFSLYLVQFPILISLTSWLVVNAGRSGLTEASAIGIIAVSTVACICAACLFKPVEALTRYFGRQISRLTITPEPEALPTLNSAQVGQ